MTAPLATVLGVLDTYTLECLDSDFKPPPASRRLMEQAAADLTAVVLAAVEDAGPALRVEELLRLLYYRPQNPDIYCAIADSYRDAGGRDIAKSFYMMAAVIYPGHSAARAGLLALPASPWGAATLQSASASHPR